MQRSRASRWVIAFSASLAFAAFAAGTRADSPERRADLEVESIAMTVGDLDRAIAFYTEVLAFEPVTESEIAGDEYEQLFGVFGMRARIARLALGDEAIDLIQFLAPSGRPMPTDSHGNDGWFQHIAIIVSDMDRAYAVLRAHHVQHASSGPQTLPAWNPNAGGIRAFYFRDPDGHYLEVLEFPPGKGKPRWQSDERLFLGIDHTAIVVADTEASLAFYRDGLGLSIAGTAENYGIEQERLNGVFGARLRITTLAASRAGIGIELLEYLAPRTGRPMPLDTRASDLWHWHIRFDATPQDIDTRVHGRGGRYVSPGIVTLPAAATAAARAASPEEVGSGLMLRDPDGHALLFGRAY